MERSTFTRDGMSLRLDSEIWNQNFGWVIFFLIFA